MDLRGLTPADQSDDIATADIRNIRFSFQAFPMSIDEIKDYSFTDGFVAQGHPFEPGELKQTPEYDRGRQERIHALRVKTRYGQSRFHRGLYQLRLKGTDVFQCHRRQIDLGQGPP